MFQNLDVFRTAMSLARHAGLQQAVSAQNIANADTPGYRAWEIPGFAEFLRSDTGAQRATRAGHLNGAAAEGPSGHTARHSESRETVDPNDNTVSLEAEMVKAVDASRAHNRALSIYRSNLNILRASLGR